MFFKFGCAKVIFLFFTWKKTRGIREILSENVRQKTFVIIFLSGLLITQHALAQFSDNFSDGNFNANPAWSGTISDFTINAGLQLQTNNIVAATSYLSTSLPSQTLEIAEWTFVIKLGFAPSATNFARIYLASDQANLTGSLNGYYLQFGEVNSNDAIELFKQTGNTSTSVCRGTNGTIANAFATNARVKITRSALGLWSILADYTGGTNFVTENSATDNSILASVYLGVRCTYTSTNAQKFFFDDFSVLMQAAPDLTAPQVTAVTVSSSTSVDVIFSEIVTKASAEDLSNYLINQNVTLSSTLHADKKTVTLNFSQPFVNGLTQSITIQNVQDVALNPMSAALKSFLFFQPSVPLFKDIVINELLPDPTQVIGLPEAEFVELYNRSANPFDLSGWQLTDGTSTGILGTLILLPGEHLILSNTTSSPLFQPFGKRMALTTWPSLNNSSDLIKLKSPLGMVIDSVGYSLTWYQNDEKKDGGYSLELIDPENFCKGAANWKASESVAGGTPGIANSILSITPDLLGPKLLEVNPISATEIELAFDERLSKAAIANGNLSITPILVPNKIVFTNIEHTTIHLLFPAPLDSTVMYSIQANQILDCPGNLIQQNFSSLDFKLDQVKPTIISVSVISSSELLIIFSERIDVQSGETQANYSINNFQTSVTAEVQPNQKSVLMTLDEPLPNGIATTITIKNIVDRAGNLVDDVTKPILFFMKMPSHLHDIIITEIFADPTPPVGLPEAEFLEVFNRSTDPFNLKNWSLSDATTTAVLPDYILLPGDYLILTLTSKVSSFIPFGKTLGVVGFPSLNNTGEPLVLKDENQLAIDSVLYSDKWYGSAEKKDGGYSLELIDTENFCRGGANWVASTDINGGTPAARNSVYNILPDVTGPTLSNIKPISDSEIELLFDERMSKSTATISTFVLSPAVGIDTIFFSTIEQSSLHIQFLDGLDSAQLYSIQFTGVSDCPGNLIQPEFASREFKLDQVRPTILTLGVVNSRELKIAFSEKISKATGEIASNFSSSSIDATSAVLAADGKSITVNFPTSFTNGVKQSLFIKNISDPGGNIMKDSVMTFLYFQKTTTTTHDVIITEIFADPTPPVGLPEAEFLEVFNRSTDPFNLKNWSLSDATTTAVLPDYILLPGDYLILTLTSKVSSFIPFGKTLGVVGFPSLNNTGEPLVLKDENQLAIDSVLYSDKWYGSAEKKDGGYSLELIDPDNFCKGAANWKASESVTGGTPGIANSILSVTPDLVGPKLLEINPISAIEIELKFDDRLSKTAIANGNFSITPIIAADEILFTDLDQSAIHLQFAAPLDSTVMYSVQTNQIFDCPGNLIQQNFSSLNFKLDQVKPTIVSISIISPSELLILFSECVDGQAGETQANYFIDVQSPFTAQVQPGQKSVLITLDEPLQNGIATTITIKNITDRAGNPMDETVKPILFFTKKASHKHDVIITEIFADPTPPVGLPEAEFLEVFNRSNNPFNLKNWTLSDATSIAVLPDHILLPGDYLILTLTSKISSFTSFGKTLGVVGFPSLNNTGEPLVLKDENQITIDSVLYSDKWYGSAEKKDGGFSLERIDTENFCRGSANWVASTDINGGTPAAKNSVYNILPDVTGPILSNIKPISDSEIELLFDERMSKSTATISTFVLFPAVGIDTIFFSTVEQSSLHIQFLDGLDSAQLYSIQFTGVSDCSGNLIQPEFAFSEFKLDQVRPMILKLDVLNPNNLKISFSEKISNATAEIASNFSSPSVDVTSAVVATDGKSVTVNFSAAFVNGIKQFLSIKNISDQGGNIMKDSVIAFLYFQKTTTTAHDVIITEIFADPTPPVGLPETEFLEVFNRSNNPFNLKNWTLSDATSIAMLPDHILLPGDYLILTLTSKALSFSSFGKTLGVVGFPSLNNTGEPLVLKDENRLTIDSVFYTDKWYGSTEKKDGGFSLERIDTENFCRGAANWIASVDINGGTPGEQNSVYSITPDLTGPKLLNVKPKSASQIELQFDERMGRSALQPANFGFIQPIVIDSIFFSTADQSLLTIQFTNSLDSSQNYIFHVENVFDCPGNLIQPEFASREFKLDQVRPTILTLDVVNSKELKIAFSEKISKATGEIASNFSSSFIDATSAILAADGKSITVNFATAFTNGVKQSLFIKNISDPGGNIMKDSVVTFLYFQKTTTTTHDIIITEIFADPTPSVGLPEAEFLEIFNRSTDPFNLKNWSLSDATSKVLLPDYLLLPGEYLVLTQTTKQFLFTPFGKTLGVVGFPSLNNTGEPLVLKDDNHLTIDSVFYSDKWYLSPDKKDAGFTLELIDTENFCRGSANWRASADTVGGTPGKKNSVYKITPYLNGPKLLSAMISDAKHLTLQFDEPLAKEVISHGSVNIIPYIGIDSLKFEQGDLSMITATTSVAFDSTTLYSVVVSQIHDCSGNDIQTDFVSTRFKLDQTKPELKNLVVNDGQTLRVEFSEKVSKQSAALLSNYFLNELTSPLTVAVEENLLSIILTFEKSFENGTSNILSIAGVADRAGNFIEPVQKSFLFFRSSDSHNKDVIVTEIFADPSPIVGLPETEFIEIYNRTEIPFNLLNWKLSDENSTRSLPNFILLPKHYLILCSTAKVAQFSGFGKTVGLTSFPSLSNSGEALVLKNEFGALIDSVNYTIDYYHDDEKKDGGWSIELIDSENICAESTNWIASEDLRGGTPGVINSVTANKPDLTSPKLVSAFASEKNKIVVDFDEKLEKKIPLLASIEIEPLISISSIRFADNTLRRIEISTEAVLQLGQLYKLTISDVYDCAGNKISNEFNALKFALPEEADSLDILVNEILFNPRPGGNDFVEFYNNSNKYVDLKHWQVENANGALTEISRENLLLAPDDYLVVTNDPKTLKSDYLNGKEEKFVAVNLPSFNDDAGIIKLVNSNGKIIDELSYNESFHSPLLIDKEGVSLERISFFSPAETNSNWKSASQASGFATPGFLNSNAFEQTTASTNIDVVPEIFDPNFGYPTFTTIGYSFDHPGFVASVKIFDAFGREVKQLADNELLGTTGFFRWDGDSENGNKASVGAYIMRFEIFNQEGQLLSFKRRIVIALSK